MKQIEGNSPKCWSCYFYTEKEQGDGCRLDGWCHNPRHNRYGVNGRVRQNPPEREPVRWDNECYEWEDAEDRISHYDYVTGAYKKRKKETNDEMA